MTRPREPWEDTSAEVLDTAALETVVPAMAGALFSAPVTLAAGVGLIPLWAAGPVIGDIIEEAGRLGVELTPEDVLHFVACAGLVRTGLDALELVAAVEKAQQGRWEEIDTCPLIALLRVGICAARRFSGLTFLPDLMGTWLEGRGTPGGALTTEALALGPAGAEASPVSTIAYYAVPGDFYFVDPVVSVKVNETMREQYHEVLAGACSRLRGAPTDLFPTVKDADATEVVLMDGGVTIPQAANLLLNTGREWLVAETACTKVGPGDHQEIGALGTFSVLSEVLVTAERGSNAGADGVVTDGWFVSVGSWRSRAWDKADFHAGNTWEVPVPGAGGGQTVKIPDDVFLRICKNECWFGPHPVDFLTCTPRWRDMRVPEFGHTRVFIPDAALCSEVGTDLADPVYVPV